tara:strand:+ start:44 stop:1090 length:1047 start_codon:yes stop_codon:yes gene_type:complete
MAINFKTASRAELDAHMGMNDLQIVDPGVIRKDNETGMFSVIDVATAVTGKPPRHAADDVRTVVRGLPELSEKISQLRINGKGRQTPVADLPTLVEIIWELPGKAAKRFRRTSAKYVVRILGGDPSLVDEIKRQDQALNQTEAGREFQQTALKSTDSLGKREREEALLGRRARRVRTEIDILETCKRLLCVNGGWLPHNEQTYRVQVSHVLQGVCTSQLALEQAPGSPVRVYSVGPYLSTKYPEHRTQDNFKGLGGLTAFLYRVRYRPDNAAVDDLKASADHLLRKPFLVDDVTKNGTSQVQVKAYESCDHDLIERAFRAHNDGLKVRDLRAMVLKKGLGVWDAPRLE